MRTYFIRGGSYISIAAMLRNRFIIDGVPAKTFLVLGFRCVINR